ncbi:MAG: hypothetical protein J3T61_12940, partial [Candidatus Brocadiales bacterium]|nr:hypothetical protein [Candidatus Bathyanammoxibius sp.]
MPGLAPSFIRQAANVFCEAFELQRMVISRHRNGYSTHDEFETAEGYWIKLATRGQSLIQAMLCLDRSSLPPESHDLWLPLKFANDAAQDLVEHKGNQAAVVDLIEEVHFDRLGWLAYHGLEAVKKEGPSDIEGMLAWPVDEESDVRNLDVDNRQPPPQGKGGRWKKQAKLLDVAAK